MDSIAGGSIREKDNSNGGEMGRRAGGWHEPSSRRFRPFLCSAPSRPAYAWEKHRRSRSLCESIAILRLRGRMRRVRCVPEPKHKYESPLLKRKKG